MEGPPMWKRRTFHECAEELGVISQDFRAAHTNRFGWDHPKRERAIVEISQRGVELLRILALSIRSDQDYGLTENNLIPVGAFKSNVADGEVVGAINDYRPPYNQLDGYTPVGLRQALNKIAHADPTRSGFFADDQTHDLILSGVDRGQSWIAIISLIDLCHIIKLLPDASTGQ
jgi:hypothetical protein